VHTDWLADAKVEICPSQLHSTANSRAEIGLSPKFPFVVYCMTLSGMQRLYRVERQDD